MYPLVKEDTLSQFKSNWVLKGRGSKGEGYPRLGEPRGAFGSLGED